MLVLIKEASENNRKNVYLINDTDIICQEFENNLFQTYNSHYKLK